MVSKTAIQPRPASPDRRHRLLAVAPRLLVVLIAAVAAEGCRDAAPAAGTEPALSRGEFIDVVVSIRQAELDVVRGDSATDRFQERKAEVLDRHGVTEADLESFVQRHADDPAVLREVWDSIAHRLRHVPAPDLDAVLGPTGPSR